MSRPAEAKTKKTPPLVKNQVKNSGGEANASKKFRIGELLVSEGYLSKEKLEQALTAQRKQEDYKPLGEVLVSLGFITNANLKRALRKHQKNINLGDMLISLGLIDKDQLQQLLTLQKKEGGRIGELLLKKGFVKESDLIDTLSEQMGIPKILPHVELIDKALLKGVNLPYLNKHEAIPMFKEDDVLTVVMADPLTIETVNDLEKFFQCKVETAIAPSYEIKKSLKELERYYGRMEFGKESRPAEFQKDLVIGDVKLSGDTADGTQRVVNYIITNGILEGASDIHIEPQQHNLRISFRIDGVLHHKTDLPLSIASNFVNSLKVICNLDITEHRMHQDGRTQARLVDQEVDLRISIYPCYHGENVVLRIIPRDNKLINLDMLGLSPVNRIRYEETLAFPSGIIMVTGPTGCGKSTSLYASINHLNNSHNTIITVEDPVEQVIDGVVQGQLDEKSGMTYMDFIKSMMRQDPDILMIGEIREKSVAEATIQAALTGHKVITSFHTADTASALLRLMDMGIDAFLISSTVAAVLAQRLLRKLCKSCREPYTPKDQAFETLNINEVDLEKFTFYESIGCSECANTGYRGRTAIHELLVINDPIREALLAQKTAGEIRLVARQDENLITMQEDGFYKASTGITSLDEVLRVAYYTKSDKEIPRAAAQIMAMCKGESGSAI